MEPTPTFYAKSSDEKKASDWTWLLSYFKRKKWQVAQVFILLGLTSLLQLVLPFLTQSIVDTGINQRDLNFITVVLMAQLALVFSRSIADFIRSRVLLQVSTAINLSILSDFWRKLMRLPISYFTQRHIGDTLQRIADHKHIQEFLTGTALNTLFSSLTLLIYAVVLLVYNQIVFGIFFFGSALYLVWILIFLKANRKLNYKAFKLSSDENGATLELIAGMPEIKLNNAEQLKRWQWEGIQAEIFKVNYKTLSLSQLQQIGALLINQSKDILITFIVAKAVVDGQLTLGAMVAIQYILGQVNGPVEQLVQFVQHGQEAKISLERLNEVHSLSDEANDRNTGSKLPLSTSISLQNVSFAYPGPGNDPVLKNLSIFIPEKKITAIVGVSGSGKTTLIKLLLQYYSNYEGRISVGDDNLLEFNPSLWRRNCGVVMQDGYFFNDTIARNIAVGDEVIDATRLQHVCEVANILEFIQELPNGFNTMLGDSTIGLSQGQRQRILIARALYKDPPFLFFDEATNALDANNEKLIVDNLNKHLVGRTVVVVAHRLSTVRHADNIVVMGAGEIIEQGHHSVLIEKRGKYFELIKNQLELGN
jgi:ATP-binding cassette, subfamily B, bacterial